MKNMKKLFAMMLMIASLFFIACEDDSESVMSKEDAITELNTLDTGMSGYLEEMVNSDGMEALEIMMSLPDPFATSKSTRTSVIPNIKKYLLPVNPEKTKSTFEAEPFNFAAWVGTYSWNSTYQKWDVQSNVPSDKIIIEFPSEGSTTNDIKITIYNYEEVNIPYYDDYWQDYYDDYYPTAILADLYINEVKVVEIDLDADWVTTGETAGDPTSFDISVYLMPFTFTGNFDHTSSAASIDFSIKYETEQIFSAGVNATFENSDMDSPLTIGGYVQLLNVKVEATIDMEGIQTIFTALENQTSTYTTVEELTDAINDEIDAVVLIDGVKAADIEIEYDPTSEEMITVVFVFADGTTAPALPYFDNFVTDIDDFFYFLEGIYGDW